MDKNTLYPILLKNFLRVCRENKFYYPLKKQWVENFNSRNGNKNYTPRKSFFNENLVLNNILEIADQTIEDMSKRQRRDGSDYEYVMIATNSLLHLFLEGKDFCNHHKIPQLGEEIFNRTCYQLYGTKFLEDMKKFKQEHPHQPHHMSEPRNMGQILSELTSRFHVNLNDIINEHRDIDGNIQWEELNNHLFSLYDSLVGKEFIDEEIADEDENYNYVFEDDEVF